MYPSKDEVLEGVKTTNIPNEVLEICHDWKVAIFDGQWKKAVVERKNRAIVLLLSKLAEYYQIKITISFSLGYFACNPVEQIIYLNADKPSIISSLHEFGHALKGSSELEACVFSTKIFQEVFPEQYNKLTWNRHMLVKRT